MTRSTRDSRVFRRVWSILEVEKRGVKQLYEFAKMIGRRRSFSLCIRSSVGRKIAIGLEKHILVQNSLHFFSHPSFGLSSRPPMRYYLLTVPTMSRVKTVQEDQPIKLESPVEVSSWFLYYLVWPHRSIYLYSAIATPHQHNISLISYVVRIIWCKGADWPRASRQVGDPWISSL